jgi:O-antigen ligase
MRIERGRISVDGAIYDLSSISGTRVAEVAGNLLAWIAGLLVFSALLPYAGCAYVASASGASSALNLPVAAGAVLGLVLCWVGKTANRHFVVLITVPAGEVVVAREASLEEAEKTQAKIETARTA